MNVKGKGRTAVLLASHNGLLWIAEQLESILTQEGVDIDIWVSDDMSTDGTWEWLNQLPEVGSRIHLLPRSGRLGSAGRNFYHLLLNVDLESYEYIAFADQDDIWSSNKIITSISTLNEKGVSGVSSDVTAFWDDGREREIIKSQPQRRFDYLFESAGPGCTYVFTSSLAKDINALLRDESISAKNVALHDWLTYAVCRALGRKWFIMPESTVQYRQHGANVFGSNTGFSAAQTRHQKIVNGWYKSEVDKILTVCLNLQPEDKFLFELRELLRVGNITDRLKLLLRTSKFRRRKSAQVLLGGYFITGHFWGRSNSAPTVNRNSSL